MSEFKILVCVDGSDEALKAARLSANFARLNPGSELTLLHVLDDAASHGEVPDNPIYRERKKAGENILAEARKIVESEGVSCATRLIVGPIALEIVRLAEREGYTMIYTGTRGKSGFKRMLVGSVADKIIRYAHCPVTVIR